MKGVFGEIDVSEEIAIENYPEDVKDSAYDMTYFNIMDHKHLAFRWRKGGSAHQI